MSWILHGFSQISKFEICKIWQYGGEESPSLDKNVMAVDKVSLSNKSYQTWWLALLLLPTFSDPQSGVCLLGLPDCGDCCGGSHHGGDDGGGGVAVECNKTPHGSVYPGCEIPSHALNIKFKSSHCLAVIKKGGEQSINPVSDLTEISWILNTSVTFVS